MVSAHSSLGTGRPTGPLAKRVEQVRAAVEAAVADSGLLVELERIRLEQATIKEGRFAFDQATHLYANALRDYGVDPTAPEAAAVRVRDSRLRETLLVALEDWWRVSTNNGERQQLEQLLQAVEPPDSIRIQWRAGVKWRDRVTLARLAREMPGPDLPATTVCSRA
jgi:hypothetical protein